MELTVVISSTYSYSGFSGSLPALTLRVGRSIRMG